MSQHLINAVMDQRNEALNNAALAAAKVMELGEEIEAMEKQMELLREEAKPKKGKK